jgi:hypothetical protein
MADQFDVILDQCLADLASGQATIEGCLKRYPAYAGQLGPLLSVAEKVRATPAQSAPSTHASLLGRFLTDFRGATGSS